DGAFSARHGEIVLIEAITIAYFHCLICGLPFLCRGPIALIVGWAKSKTSQIAFPGGPDYAIVSSAPYSRRPNFGFGDH
ncbi:MAG: hypothetical protein ACR2P3_08460, partial [Geminicoccaceae bacterium]